MRREAESHVAVEPFDNYVSNALETRRSRQPLHGHRIPAFSEGEKHLIYVTTDGLFLPSLDHDSAWRPSPRRRVAIDTVQTGGIFADLPGCARSPRTRAAHVGHQRRP